MRRPPAQFLTLRRARRLGLVSVVVLIALVVIGLIGAALLKSALSRRAEVALEERRLQASWLAESALDRASSRLLESADYAGEAWEVKSEELGGRGAGSARIRVEPVPDHPDRRRVAILAEYPSDSPRSARRSLDVVLTVTPKSR